MRALPGITGRAFLLVGEEGIKGLSRNKLFNSGSLYFFFNPWGKLRLLKYLKFSQWRKNGKEQVNMNIYFLTTP